MSKKANYQELKEFQVWRNKLYNSLASRRETVMELIDSLSSNLQASSVVELSLNPLFQRNKPISVGHSYSVLAALPERERTENVPWAVPILGDRIPSESKAIEMGNKQVKNLFKTDNSSWYADRFDLKDKTTWHPPDEVLISDFITKKGRKLNLTIWGWKEMLMKGTSNYKMNRHPFTLLQITITDEKGNNVWKPMWLIVIGSRRFGVKS